MDQGMLSRLQAHPPSRRAIVMCMVAVWFCLVIGQMTPCFQITPDSATYLLLARSITHGDGYTVDGLFMRGYPPLFPLMLSTVASPERQDYRPEKLIFAAAALGALLSSFWYFSQRYRGWTLAALSLILAVAPALISEASRIRSDTPFLFLAMLSLAAADKYWGAERTDWRLALLAAATLALAALTRSAGIVLYLTNFAWLARPARWRQDARRCAVFAVFIILVAVPPLVGWSIEVAAHRESGTQSYLEYAQSKLIGDEVTPGAVAHAAMTQAGIMLGQIASAASTILPIPNDEGAALFTIVFVLHLLFGLMRRFREPAPSDYAFCGYTVMILVWPSVQGTRFWLPVLPLMLGYLSDGIAGFGEFAAEFPTLAGRKWIAAAARRAAKYQRGAAITGALILLGFGIGAGIRSVAVSWRRCENAVAGVLFSRDLQDVATFLKAPHDQPVVLASDRARELELALARPGISVTYPPKWKDGDAPAYLASLQDLGITHIALDKTPDRGEARKLLDSVESLRAAMPDALRPAVQTKRMSIYEVHYDVN